MHRKLISTPVKFRNHRKETSPNEHKLKRLGGKYTKLSKIEQQKCITAGTRTKMQTIETDDEDGDFDFYNKSDDVVFEKELKALEITRPLP